MEAKKQISKVSVVVTTHNRKDKVLNTIRSVLASGNSELIQELIVIDDASNDGTCDAITTAYSNNRRVQVIRCNEEKLVSAARNIGSAKAQGDFIFFLDDDVIVSPSAIYDLASYLSRNSHVACALPLILYHDRPRVIWCAGVKHNFWTTLGSLIGQNEVDNYQFKEAICTDSVMTAFMVRKSVADNVKFDSKIFPIGWEDMDYTTRIKKRGWGVVVLPWVKVRHDYPGANFLKSRLRLYSEVKNRIVFHRRWSQNAPQYFLSVSFSVAVGLNYIALSLFFADPTCFIENTKTVLKALIDELFHPTKL